MKSTYRLSSQAMSESLGPLYRIGLIGGVMVVAGSVGWPPASAGATQDSITLLIQIIAGGLVVLGIAFVLIAVVLAIMLRKTLVISPQGLEYNEWPLYAVVCPWRQVTGLERKVTQGRAVTRLIIERPPSSQVTPGDGRDAGSTVFITVSDLEGWSRGDLEKELRLYAPHLFGPPQ